MQIRGEVVVVNSRTSTSKKTGKPYTLWSLKVRGDDGSESDWIDAGFDKPAVVKGAYVSATAEKNARGYLELKSLDVVPAPAPVLPAAATAATVVEGSGAADRQTQIVLQHSQEMAIAEVTLLLANGGLQLSTAQGKPGVAKRYEEITKAVEKLTVQRYFDVVTGRLLESVADAGGVELGVDGPIPPFAGAQAASGDDD